MFRSSDISDILRWSIIYGAIKKPKTSPTGIYIGENQMQCTEGKENSTQMLAHDRIGCGLLVTTTCLGSGKALAINHNHKATNHSSCGQAGMAGTDPHARVEINNKTFIAVISDNN